MNPLLGGLPSLGDPESKPKKKKKPTGNPLGGGASVK